MKIDEIIKSKRDQLDVEQPPADLWENIRDEWKSETKKSTMSAWKVAASILLITSFGLLLYTRSLHQEIDQLASLGDISVEYKTIENQYQSEVEALETSIPLQEIGQSKDYEWLLEELKTLDQINQLYRADIGKVGNEDQLVQVLIDYYEKKIKLLKKLDLEISRDKKNQEVDKRKELKI